MAGERTEGERFMIELEKAEAFVRDHPYGRSVWVRWAKGQPNQVKQMFRRIHDNTRTTQASSPGQPVQFEPIHLSIPCMDDLSPGLRMMIRTAFGVWDSGRASLQ